MLSCSSYSKHDKTICYNHFNYDMSSLINKSFTISKYFTKLSEINTLDEEQNNLHQFFTIYYLFLS